MIKKFLIYGFGRMGLTHYAILNQLIDNAEFVFVDLNRKVNFFARRNLNAKIVSTDKSLYRSFDFALICTPPMFHVSILKKCIEKKIPNIFVEKPFGGVCDDFSSVVYSDASISIGYVLRFNPIVQWIKKNLEIDKVEKVEGFYFSNTIEKKPKGWRNGSYSGVTNEVGAHIIDLCVYIFGLSNPSIVSRQINSIISDIDDVLIADLEDKSIKYHFHFDWVNKQYRKPVFKFVITLKEGLYIKFDQQKVEYFDSAHKLLSKLSVADIAEKVPFYLRGIEFTSQMQDFVGSKANICKLSESLIARNVIKKLLLNDTNFR